jgi:hypothetical protein
MRIVAIPLLILALSGCVNNSVVNPIESISSVNSTTGELRTQPSLNVVQNAEISAETLAAAGGLYVLGHPENVFGLSGQVFGPAQTALLYVVYDPLAPNWTVKERALKADMFHLSLRAKSFRVGGDGEAYQILKRRAAYLQRSGGYASYRILDYSEGVESSTPLTHRVGEGTILLVRAETASRR